MKNVTITLDEEVARWARIQAAQGDKSLSRFIADLLRDLMARRTAYEEAMRRYLSRKPVAMKKKGAYPRREELYDRPRLR